MFNQLTSFINYGLNIIKNNVYKNVSEEEKKLSKQLIAENFPKEILLYIFSMNNNNNKDLSNLSLVNKKFNRLSNEIINTKYPIKNIILTIHPSISKFDAEKIKKTTVVSRKQYSSDITEYTYKSPVCYLKLEKLKNKGITIKTADKNHCHFKLETIYTCKTKEKIIAANFVYVNATTEESWIQKYHITTETGVKKEILGEELLEIDEIETEMEISKIKSNYLRSSIEFISLFNKSINK